DEHHENAGVIGMPAAPDDVAPGKFLLAGKQKNIKSRHRCSPRPDDVVPVEPERPEHAQDEDMHGDGGDEGNPPEAARQQPYRERDRMNGATIPSQRSAGAVAGTTAVMGETIQGKSFCT